MTPKDKAKKLYAKFFCTSPQPYYVEQERGINFQEWDKDWTNAMAKKQAIICVDEILEFMKMDDEDSDSCYNANSKWVQYWIDVKEEILTY